MGLSARHSLGQAARSTSGGEASAAPSQELITKRLHVSGLTPAISAADVRSKLGSFGEVLDVRSVGLDGLGQPRPFLFADLRGTEAQIKRCLTVLGGVTWKGAKLRVGYAKMDLTQQYAAVKEAGHDERPRKRPRLPKGAGKESKRIDKAVETADVENGEWGWKKTPAGHLVRPMVQRPPHPLPRPAPLKSTEGKLISTRKSRKLSSIAPPTRARRTTLDPTRYGATHLTSLMLDAGSDVNEGDPGRPWTCEEGEQKGIVRWVRDGQEETIQLRRETPALISADSRSAHVVKEPSALQADSELAANDDPSTASEPGDIEDDTGVDFDAVLSQADAIPLTSSTTSRPTKTFFPAPYDPDRESLFSEGYDEHTAGTQSGGTTAAVDFEAERSRTLQWLRSAFGDDFVKKDDVQVDSGSGNVTEDKDDEQAISGTANRDSKETKDQGVTSVVSLNDQDEEEDDMDDAEQGVAERASRSSSSASSSLSETSAGKNRDEEPTVAAEVPSAGATDQASLPTLKEMFKPREETAGFSLLSGLDLDLNPEMDFDVEEESISQPMSRTLPSTATQGASTHLSALDEARNAPFFFPRFLPNKLPNPSPRNILMALAPTEPAPGYSVAARPASLLKPDTPIQLPFCRRHTDEELQEIWEERRTRLTDEYRRRHREAVRKKQRGYMGSRKDGQD